jgi:hypothetical protein
MAYNGPAGGDANNNYYYNNGQQQPYYQQPPPQQQAYGQQPYIQQPQPQYAEQPPPGPPPQQQQSYAAPQNIQNYGETGEKIAFEQAFKVDRPKWNDLWAGVLVRASQTDVSMCKP